MCNLVTTSPIPFFFLSFFLSFLKLFFCWNLKRLQFVILFFCVLIHRIFNIVSLVCYYPIQTDLSRFLKIPKKKYKKKKKTKFYTKNKVKLWKLFDLLLDMIVKENTRKNFYFVKKVLDSSFLLILSTSYDECYTECYF